MGNIILQTEIILSRKNHEVKGIIPIIDWKTDSDIFLLNKEKKKVPIKIIHQQGERIFLSEGKVLVREDILIQADGGIKLIALRDEHRNTRILKTNKNCGHDSQKNNLYRVLFFENGYQLWTNIPGNWKYRLSSRVISEMEEFFSIEEQDWEYFLFSMYVIDDNFNTLCVQAS